MSSGFSLNLTKKSKNSQKDNKKRKRQRQNAFGGDETAESKTKISITHVDQFKAAKPKKLIIKPDKLISTLAEVQTEKDDPQVKYGLIHAPSDDNRELPTDSIINKQRLTDPEARWSNQVPERTEEEEYEAVPVEDFGKAMLRGMGWDGDEQESEIKEQKSTKLPHQMARPLYMGLGAKDNTKGRSSGQAQDHHYLPIVKVDRNTGEVVNK